MVKGISKKIILLILCVRVWAGVPAVSAQALGNYGGTEYQLFNSAAEVNPANPSVSNQPVDIIEEINNGACSLSLSGSGTGMGLIVSFAVLAWITLTSKMKTKSPKK